MMSIGWKLIVSDPGRDDSSSGGGSDLGAAQNPWKSGLALVNNERRALGAEWTSCCPYDSLTWF